MRKMNLTANGFEEDEVQISKEGVRIFQEMEDGTKTGFFLSHEALHEVMVEVMQWAQDEGMIDKDENPA